MQVIKADASPVSNADDVVPGGEPRAVPDQGRGRRLGAVVRPSTCDRDAERTIWMGCPGLGNLMGRIKKAEGGRGK